MIVVFDLSGVFFNNGLMVAVKIVSEKYNLDPSEVELILNGSFSKEYRTGMISAEEFWKKAAKKLKTNNIEDIREIFFDSYYPHKESVEFIEKLKRKNIRVGFLSNSPEDRSEYLEKKFSLKGIFDFGLSSFEAHAWKPDRRIYQKLLEKFDLDPRKIIYVDDKADNLTSGKELGMKAILFKNIEQLEKDLKKLGLKI